jgi:hypothetical protein
MEKDALKKKNLAGRLDLHLRKKLVGACIWSIDFVWCWKLDTSDSVAETP